MSVLDAFIVHATLQQARHLLYLAFSLCWRIRDFCFDGAIAARGIRISAITNHGVEVSGSCLGPR